MGGGQSTPSAPSPPIIIEDPYPKGIESLTNLSLAPGTTVACNGCVLGIDAKASTSSVKLTRDFGDITKLECDRYANDLNSVRANEMSFSDFLANLQAGNYSRYISQSERGQFCEQIQFPDDVVTNITTIAQFDSNVGKLKSVRIRKVTGGGGYSSGTKAKIKLSVPIKIVYADSARIGNPSKTEMKQVDGIWSWVTSKSEQVETIPDYVSKTISSMTVYHPSPIRIENIQHDAVLSLNDPSDPDASVVVLIPLKSSNTSTDSTNFFGKIAKYLSNIASPDPATGLYAETNIPTGNDWNIKNVFWLGPAGSDGVSPVTDAYFTWKGAGVYKRVKTSGAARDVIRFGWVPDGKVVRYFMLQTPVEISATDLSFLTRSLPPTPPADAIHGIPDPTITKTKISYKPATGEAAKAACGIVRERMTNQGPGDILASSFTGGGVQDLLVDEKGQPLSDKDSCDPFANNAKNIYKNPSWFTPNRVLTIFFNFLLVVSVALGAWLALYFVANKDYDNRYKEFSETAGKVVGKLALQTSGRMKEVGQSISGLTSLIKLPGRATTSDGQLPAGLENAKLPAGLGDAKLPADLGNAKLPAGLGSALKLFGKKA